jgi:hypothetical protein
MGEKSLMVAERSIAAVIPNQRSRFPTRSSQVCGVSDIAELVTARLLSPAGSSALEPSKIERRVGCSPNFKHWNFSRNHEDGRAMSIIENPLFGPHLDYHVRESAYSRVASGKDLISGGELPEWKLAA